MHRPRSACQAEASRQANTIADERRRQQDKLQGRLAAKRERQTRELLRKQERERLELAGQQARQLADARAAEARAREQAALTRVLAPTLAEPASALSSALSPSLPVLSEVPGMPSGTTPLRAPSAAGATPVIGTPAAAPAAIVPRERVGEAIEAVMQERHAKETSELLVTQYKYAGAQAVGWVVLVISRQCGGEIPGGWVCVGGGGARIEGIVSLDDVREVYL